MDRDSFLDLEDEDTYEISGATVLGIIEHLLRLVLAFYPDPEQAKGQVDRVAAILANEAAEEAERQKFGS